MSIVVVIPGLGFCAVAIMVFLSEQAEKRRWERLMSGRTPLSDEEFGEKFFPAGQAGVAIKIRHIIGKQLGIDVSRVHPSDGLVHDLRMDELDSLASVQIVCKLEEEFGIRITDNEAESISIIEQLVNCVASKLEEKRSPSSRGSSLACDQDFDT